MGPEESGQLRRGEILSGKYISLLPSLGRRRVGRYYKHPAPTELNGRDGCMAFFPLRLGNPAILATH